LPTVFGDVFFVGSSMLVGAIGLLGLSLTLWLNKERASEFFARLPEDQAGRITANYLRKRPLAIAISLCAIALVPLAIVASSR